MRIHKISISTMVIGAWLNRSSSRLSLKNSRGRVDGRIRRSRVVEIDVARP